MQAVKAGLCRKTGVLPTGGGTSCLEKGQSLRDETGWICGLLLLHDSSHGWLMELTTWGPRLAVYGQYKKKSRIETSRSGIALFIRRNISTGYAAVHAVVSFPVQAGLLTSGSPYLLRLPNLAVSDILQRSSSVTAAGPSPSCTGFPLVFLRTPELAMHRTDAQSDVKEFYY